MAETAAQPCLPRQRGKEGVARHVTTLEDGATIAHEVETEANRGNVALPVARVTHPGVHTEHPIAVPEHVPGLPNQKGKADRSLEAAVVETQTLVDREVEGDQRVEEERLPLRPVNLSAFTSLKALAIEGKRVDSVLTSPRAGINPLRLAVFFRRL
jgi:hypothetical protein